MDWTDCRLVEESSLHSVGDTREKDCSVKSDWMFKTVSIVQVDDQEVDPVSSRGLHRLIFLSPAWPGPARFWHDPA